MLFSCCNVQQDENFNVSMIIGAILQNWPPSKHNKDATIHLEPEMAMDTFVLLFRMVQRHINSKSVAACQVCWM
jgi:hypothetical protein